MRSLTGTLRLDLDWLVMKCLETDRGRRYETPDALSHDLDRHITNLPVHAGPPTPRYLVGKFVQRHRVAVCAAAAFVLLLTAGIAGTTYGLLHASREAKLAREAEHSEREQREIAEREAELRAQSQTFLTGLFSYSAPDGLGRETTQLQSLESAIAELDEAGRVPPLEEARRCSDLATAMAGLGEFDRALALARRGLNAIERIDTPGDASSELLAFDLRRTSANIFSDLARYEEALHEHRELITLSGGLYGQSDARTLRALRSFAITQRRTGNAEQAVGLLQEIALIARTSRDPDNKALAVLIRIDLVSALNFLGRGDESFEESSRLLDDAKRIELPVIQ